MLFLLTTVATSPSPAAESGWPTPGLAISANKDLLTPGETMRISVSVDTSRIHDTVADLYLAVQPPDGTIEFHIKKPAWHVADWPLTQAVSLLLRNQDIGPYHWFFVLSKVGTDPLDSVNWIGYSSVMLTVLPVEETEERAEVVPPPCRPACPSLIAHAGGTIKGLQGTNSREALDENYRNGQRHFEIDLSWTSDGRIVAMHDWGISMNALFGQPAERPSLQRFTVMPMVDSLTQMPLENLLEWLATHRGAYLITDFKERNLEGLRRVSLQAQQDLKRRIIPQIYQKEDFNPVNKMGFEKIIFTLYRSPLKDEQVIEFASRTPLFAVTLPVHRAFYSNLANQLARLGTATYAHTINHPEVFGYLRNRGIHGVYTDHITPLSMMRRKAAYDKAHPP